MEDVTLIGKGKYGEHYVVFKKGKNWPEEYLAYSETGIQIGYISLSIGYLKAKYPNIDGDMIYSYKFRDSDKNTFDTAIERDNYLKQVADVLIKEAEKNWIV